MPAHLRLNDYGVWYLIDGFRRQSLKTKVEREAKIKLKLYQEGRLPLVKSESVETAYTDWIADKVPPLVRPSRARDYKQAFNAYILPRFRHVALSNITADMLNKFRAELTDKGLSVKTCRNIIDGCFRAMYRDKRGDLKDVFVQIQWPKPKQEPPDPLTAEEKRRICEAFLKHEPFYYPFICVQLDTGMRPSETIALTWADINAGQRTIRINKSRHLGQDNDHPKTTHSGRTITISRALMDLIETLRHPWSKPSDKVFLNKHGDPLNAASFRIDYWDRILDALQIRKHKFYACRHTFISDMVGKNVNLKRVADYCGTSVAMIEKHYCAISELDPDSEVNLAANSEVMAKSANFLNDIMASPTGFEPVLSA